MPKTFEIKDHGEYISVILSEDYDVSPEQEAEFWTTLKNTCSQHDCYSVLLEGFAPKREPDVTEIVQSGVNAATAVPNLWLAICLENFEPSELSELFKTIARSHGVHVKFFTDRDQALLWLRSGAAS